VGWGAPESTWYGGLLYKPPIIDEYGAFGGMRIGRGNRGALEKTCPSATSSTTSPTWPDLFRPATLTFPTPHPLPYLYKGFGFPLPHKILIPKMETFKLYSAYCQQPKSCISWLLCISSGGSHVCDDIHEHRQGSLNTACYWLCDMYSELSAWSGSDDRLYKYRASWRQTWLNCRYCRRAPVRQDGAIPILVLPKVNDRLTPHKWHTHGYDSSINLRMWSHWKRNDRIVSDRSFPDSPVEFSTPMNVILSVTAVIKTHAARPQPSHSRKERVGYALLPRVLTDFSADRQTIYLSSSDFVGWTTIRRWQCDHTH
jgi:hypothetical protein